MKVVILGAGCGGIAAAAALRRRGLADFTILERADGVGGTWRANTYPGAACDVPSHLYSFSFALKRDWSRTYASQPEILVYLEDCADRLRIRPHLRTGTAVERLRWDDGARQWEIACAGGETLRADAVISALGMLEVPRLPELLGRDDFAGAAFHSARWDHGIELDGARVGVVGTGASAIQVVPAIADRVAHLSVFQRSPAWILPKADRPHTEEELQRFRRPLAARRHRWKLYWEFERNTSFRIDDEDTAKRERFARRWLEKSVADEALRSALTPDYPIGCKRILPSNDFYPALQREHVDLVTAPIERVVRDGIVTADGHHPLDVIVWCTGFRAAEYLSRIRVEGRDGRDLHDEWASRGGADAYKGITVSGFPNLFLLYGPNTNQGGNSILFMLEAQARYAAMALRAMRRRRLAAMDVRDDVMKHYNDGIQAALQGTVWLGGCTSYFAAQSGKITTQLPHPSFWYWKQTRRFRLADYEVARRTVPGWS